jgi:hypothetical protein
VKETTQPSSAQPTAATGPKPDVFARAYAAFTALPRVGKWVAVAAAFYIVFLLFQFVVWPVADDLNEEADRAAVLLKSAGTRAEELPSDIADRAVVFGPNSVPGREITEKERFSNAVAAIMKKHGVADAYGFDARPQALPGDVLPRVSAQYGGKMGRTVAELKFSASAETVSKILAELDSSPFVDAISDVRLVYKDRRVSAVLSIERWGVAAAGGGA